MTDSVAEFVVYVVGALAAGGVGTAGVSRYRQRKANGNAGLSDVVSAIRTESQKQRTCIAQEASETRGVMHDGQRTNTAEHAALSTEIAIVKDRTDRPGGG